MLNVRRKPVVAPLVRGASVRPLSAASRRGALPTAAALQAALVGASLVLGVVACSAADEGGIGGDKEPTRRAMPALSTNSTDPNTFATATATVTPTATIATVTPTATVITTATVTPIVPTTAVAVPGGAMAVHPIAPTPVGSMAIGKPTSSTTAPIAPSVFMQVDGNMKATSPTAPPCVKTGKAPTT